MKDRQYVLNKRVKYYIDRMGDDRVRTFLRMLFPWDWFEINENGEIRILQIDHEKLSNAQRLFLLSVKREK